MANLLDNKVALITGGAAGIGKATALMFAEHGAQVVVLDNNRASLDQLQSEFAAANHSLLAIEGDALVTADIQRAMASVAEQFDKLDILVNNVGDFLGLVKPLEQMSDEEIDRLMSVNLRHPMICSREAIPLLKKAGGGSIITVSSIEGFRGMPNITPYGAAKAGIEGFTKSLALEVARYGIRVNEIAPETTETDQVNPKAIMSDEDYQRAKQWIPLKRFGAPKDSAGCALFLASDLSSWVTGTTSHCEGGALAAAGWYTTPDCIWTNTPVIERGAIPGMPNPDGF